MTLLSEFDCRRFDFRENGHEPDLIVLDVAGDVLTRVSETGDQAPLIREAVGAAAEDADAPGVDPYGTDRTVLLGRLTEVAGEDLQGVEVLVVVMNT